MGCCLTLADERQRRAETVHGTAQSNHLDGVITPCSPAWLPFSPRALAGGAKGGGIEGADGA